MTSFLAAFVMHAFSTSVFKKEHFGTKLVLEILQISSLKNLSEENPYVLYCFVLVLIVVLFCDPVHIL